MKTFIRIGIDLAKTFFQVHAIEREGAPAVSRKLSRGKVLAFFAQTAPCRVGMEACGSSHYWAREIRALGHEVVLISPALVKAAIDGRLPRGFGVKRLMDLPMAWRHQWSALGLRELSER
jgi:transposase